MRLGLYVCSFLISSALQGQRLQWADSAPFAFGSGCDRSSVSFVVSGEELSILFSNLGVSLTSEQDPLLDRKDCTISMPVLLYANQIFGNLSQSLVFGYIRDGGEGNIATQVQLLPAATAEATTLPIPDPNYDNISAPFIQSLASQTDLEECLSKTILTFLVMQISVSAQRPNNQTSVVAQVDGCDFALSPMDAGICIQNKGPSLTPNILWF